MAVVHPEVRKTLVNFAIAELAKPPSNHAFSFVKSELGSSRHLLLTALLLANEESERESETKTFSDVKISYVDLKLSSSKDYKIHFRMNRKTIQGLVVVLGKKLAASPEIVHPLIPVEKKVLLTCWLMGNKQSYMSAAKMFELSKGTVYRIFHQICNELTKLAARYVRWPDPEECEEIAASFESTYGFPGVIGVIDACHIEIREPEDDASKFLNSETGQYTLLLQTVVDHKSRFRDVCAGFPGQSSKSKVLLGSPLYSKLTSRMDPLIEPNKHLLGGTEYLQLSTLLTPYSGDDLTPQEQKYNELHQDICAVVQQVYANLKKRFPRLNFIDVSRTELASKVVVAACVLHNFAVMHDDVYSADTT